MGLIARSRKLFEALQLLSLALACAALVIFPKESIGAAKDGVMLCLNIIVPSLFPFFVLSSMIIDTGATRSLDRMFEKFMRPLFNVSGACAAPLVLGFIGGYPVGAKTVISLYENGGCTKSEAERLLAFCNNSGPAFILGVVGAGVFSSGKIGLLLYLAHTCASILVGALFRFSGAERGSAKELPRERHGAPRRSFMLSFTDGVKNSFASTLNICGFVIFFTVLIKLLFISGAIPYIAGFLGKALAPLGFSEEWGEKLLTGFIEISSGVWTLRDASEMVKGSVAMAAFMLGWAGVSVHFQVLSFLAGSGLSVRTYIAGKFIQGLISAGIVFVMGNLNLFEMPVAAYLADSVGAISQVGFFKALLLSCIGAAALLLMLLPLGRRRGRRRRR